MSPLLPKCDHMVVCGYLPRPEFWGLDLTLSISQPPVKVLGLHLGLDFLLSVCKCLSNKNSSPLSILESSSSSENFFNHGWLVPLLDFSKLKEFSNGEMVEFFSAKSLTLCSPLSLLLQQGSPASSLTPCI